MILVCGDSATDQIIEMRKLDSPHVHADTIKIYYKYAFAKQLYKILKNYFENIKKQYSCVYDFSSEPLFYTISKWMKQTIDDDNNERLFFNEHVGTQRLLNKPSHEINWDIKIRYIKNKKIAAVCDIYDSDEEYYYSALKEFEWIVVRTLLQENKPSHLLERIINDEFNLKKTIVILHSADLRKAGFEIKKGVSWEQIIIETNEILSKEPWNKFAYLIVCFEHEGALLFDNKNKEYTTLFYPNEIEGDYLKNRQKVFGMLNTFHAAIIAHLCNYNNKNDIIKVLIKASKAGIIAMRELIKCGFTKECTYPYDINKIIKESIDKDWDCKAIVDLKLKRINKSITILDEICKKNDKDINTLCENIIGEGINKSLADIPVLKYEALISADCNEIENYRKIHNLFESYIKNKDIFKKPLSICVFGAPGTGKSFGITEIIKNIKKDQKSKTQILTFNLSQFKENDLSSAFNQIRNINLKDELPIVFWDEFDCDIGDQKLGWLKHFLVPMQDGQYYENGNSYHIGRAIFIFAGGIYKNSKEIINAGKENAKYKLPDFLSRIAGNYLDIYSLNQEERELKSTSKGNEMYKIRRAVIIRKLTEKYLKNIHEDYKLVDSNRNILMELLNRDLYDYGIRTLENEIIDLFVNNV